LTVAIARHKLDQRGIAVSIDCVKQHKRAMIRRYAHSDDKQGLTQVLLTLLPLAFLWWSVARFATVSLWIAGLLVPLITFFTLRVFALMHECGHGSLFRNRTLNRIAGFTLGVVAGMPQHVWSQHHNYHHAHNGNWEKYRGPYTTLSVDEYEALSPTQQRLYRGKCSVRAAPLAGFIYLIFNPRFTWIRGTVGLALHVVAAKLAQPSVPLRVHAAGYRSGNWKNAREYWHMSCNNIVLLSIWGLMCWACGSGLFFGVYVISLSLAGAMGIVLFTVQHNFEHAYASANENWDSDIGAIKGTSFLVLPAWLNWFTANIGYHHIHHLSAQIPSYRLVRCHNEYQHLFGDVVRLKLSQVVRSLDCILWDAQARRIISFAEYCQRAIPQGGSVPSQ
jgi:omega-6 fatty acid desaturase (delta-12 desaturase)